MFIGTVNSGLPVPGATVTLKLKTADFRLRTVEAYEDWYVPHPNPELISRAVYGLTEYNRDAIAGAGLGADK